MCNYLNLKKNLQKKKFNWLITGVAGFIGSNLLEELLSLNQKVIGIDNFSTGYNSNLIDVKKNISFKQWKNFKFINGDISKISDCKKVFNDKIDFVLHQAARGSVIKSIKDPIKTNNDNITGFLNVLNLSRQKKIKSFIYASSSSVYGDSKLLPKKEKNIGEVLSNYALTKKVNESYAKVFFMQYGFKSIGLRYFNVFGRRQDPNGDYAAVIPKWINNVYLKKKIEIYGDGKTSRDFTFISNIIQANILAAINKLPSNSYVFNVGTSSRITLNKLIFSIYKILKIKEKNHRVYFKPFRQGDIRHSLASIDNIKKKLGYQPTKNFQDSLKLTIDWFIKK